MGEQGRLLLAERLSLAPPCSSSFLASSSVNMPHQSFPAMAIVGLAIAALAAVAAVPGNPTMPLAFKTHKIIEMLGGEGLRQEFTWHYDWTRQTEQMVYTQHPVYPPNTTVLYVYHGTWNGPNTTCMDGNNSCATIYQWGPGAPCTGPNPSNLMDRLFGWITSDMFTKEAATY